MRTEIKVTVKGIYKYTRPGYGYHAGYEDAYIYNMTGEDGKTYVWRTSSVLSERVEVEKYSGMEYDDKTDKWYGYDKVNRGDVITIKATIKGETEYKGQPQTEVNRVVLLERLTKAETKEEYIARKADEQKASLSDGDIIWRMPYRQYKSHYSDCETVYGSYDRDDSTIAVIIRDGRLKASGVRGEHYSGYRIHIKTGNETLWTVYRAVSSENAEKRMYKDYPNAEIIEWDVIPYNNNRW